MNRDFIKKKNNIKNTSSTKRTRFWIVLSILLALLFCSALFFIAQSKKPAWVFSNITAWITERKIHLQKSVSNTGEKVKQFVANGNATKQPVHFEFYTALPNMQVGNPSPALKTVVKESLPLVSADELEKELFEQIQRSR